MHSEWIIMDALYTVLGYQVLLWIKYNRSYFSHKYGKGVPENFSQFLLNHFTSQLYKTKGV